MTRAKAKVYIQGPAYYDCTFKTFRDLGNDQYEVIQNIDHSDIVVLTGGADINPALYGEKPIPNTYFTSSRDKVDLQAVEQGYDKKKFLVGICRGAQLLNCVPNGGKLWQDVDNHESGNHPVFDCISGVWVLTNSVHHQMMKPTEEAEIIAWADESTQRRCEDDFWLRPKDLDENTVSEKEKDIEALWYPKTKSFCIQSHPEFGHRQTTEYFFYLMDHYYFGKQYQLEEVA